MKGKAESYQLKELVKKQYGEIADQGKEENASGCCGVGGGCSPIDTTLMAENYEHLDGYVQEADLGLGCGLPTQYALIKAGDTVIDLGSGAGNDAFVARSIVGSSGKVIGVDFTEKMIAKARQNADKRGYNNVEFRYGDIEELPISDNTADVVVSNCVFNLVPDKSKAFSETYRVLKPGGHFSISDIVIEGELTEEIRAAAEMYVGCISGAIQKNEYLKLVEHAGFVNIQVQKEKVITLPDEFLLQYISPEAMTELRASGTQILSITMYGEKNQENITKNANKSVEDACCKPGCCGN